MTFVTRFAEEPELEECDEFETGPVTVQLKDFAIMAGLKIDRYDDDSD